MRNRLPHMNMREAEIPLKAEKRPTETAMSKRKGKGKATVGGDVETVSTTLTFVDPPPVIRNFLASDIGKSMHKGPTLFVDEPGELFHSHC